MRSSAPTHSFALLALVAAGGCGLEVGYPEGEPEDDAARCADGVDNDRDGRADCFDDDCDGFCVEICDNDRDDDGDGAIGCDDADCPCLENTFERCHNGIDDDGNGQIDCEDRSCEVGCPEQSAAACDDGRDNDGDGLVDAADPRCWPIVRASATRCASVRGGALDAALDSRASLEGQLYVAGTEPAERAPAIIGPALAVAAGTTLGSIRPLAGAWEGTRLELLVQGDVALRLVPASTEEGTPGFAAVSFLEVTLAGSTLRVSTAAGRQELALADRTGWQLLSVEVSGGALRAALDPLPEAGTGEARALTGFPIAGVVFPTARVLVDGPGVLSRLHVRVGDLDPCGVPVPTTLFRPFEEVELRFGEEGLDVDFARGDGRVCALAIACDRLDREGGPIAVSAVSDDGLTWGAGGASLGAASAVAVAWDEAASVFRAAITDPADGAMRFLESGDCAAWTPREVSGLPPAGARYRVDPDASCDTLQIAGLSSTLSYVVAGDDAHELYWVTDVGDAPRLVRARSLDGGARFESARVVTPVAVLGPMLRVSAGPTGDDRPPRERIVTHLADPSTGELGIRLGVLAGDVYEPVPDPAYLAPSGTPRSFDRYAVRSVAFLPSDGAAARAELLVGAVGDYDGVFPGERITRFGAASLTFGAAPGD